MRIDAENPMMLCLSSCLISTAKNSDVTKFTDVPGCLLLPCDCKESSKRFLDPCSDSDDPQNLIMSSLFHFRDFLKMSSKSINYHFFIMLPTDRRTDKPTPLIT